MLFKKRALQLHQHQRHSGSIEVYCVCTCSGPASGARLMPSSLQLPSLSGLQLRRLLRTMLASQQGANRARIARNQTQVSVWSPAAHVAARVLARSSPSVDGRECGSSRQ
jgi:hypothetical protein